MAINLRDSVAFTISVTGDRTGDLWHGEFKSYKRLSHRQELMRDRIMRDLLGPNSEGASDRAKSQAELLAELQVSLVETPSWWKEAGQGMDLADDNIIQEIWKKVMEVKVAAVEEVTKKGEKLKEIAETNALNK